MNNQHAGLSQVLAQQHTTQLREQAAHARLLREARPPRRRRWWAPVAGGGWPGGRASPINQPVVRTASVDRSGATMSKLASALVLGVMLAAMNPPGMTVLAARRTGRRAWLGHAA
jgi:hypothetical protein